MKLSEQQLVDCVTTDYGCDGGMAEDVFDFLAKNAQVLETEYPYTAKDGNCRVKGTKEVKATKTNRVPRGSVKGLMAAIQSGPTSVSVRASETPFRQYTGGIVNSSACGYQCNHAINAVGYGSENG